jgi:hypothetical protein
MTDMQGNGVMQPQQQQISAEAVIAIMQREYPTEFRVCLQQAYIEQLQEQVKELTRHEP